MSHLIRHWNGYAIEQRESGFINGTAMCVANDREIREWFSNQSTIELLDAIAEDFNLEVNQGISPDSTVSSISAAYPDLVVSRRGSPSNGGGTWIHADLAVPLAQWCSPRFALQVSRWIQELLTTGSVSLQQQPQFYKRLQLFHERTGRIPAGWFCIFEEIVPLVAQLERYGYCLPEDAVIDSSIGKRFCSYLRDEYDIEPDNVCLKYPHWYPGRRNAVSANLYPLSLIQVFREWLEYRYYNQYLIPYFKGKKDPEAIQAVSKFLGLLPSA